MAFDTNDVINRLNALIAVDQDAVNAYDAAIARISNRGIRSALEMFKRDHIRHADVLSLEVRNLNGTPRPKTAHGLFGPKLSGRGDAAALRAMEADVQLAHGAYVEAVQQRWPDRLIDVLAENLSDVRRHLAFISQAIENHLWEAEPPGAVL